VELSQWRLVLRNIDTDQRQAMAVPRFDETRHAGVCAEVCHQITICAKSPHVHCSVEVPLCCDYKST
jgi:hypothetical protein